MPRYQLQQLPDDDKWIIVHVTSPYLAWGGSGQWVDKDHPHAHVTSFADRDEAELYAAAVFGRQPSAHQPSTGEAHDE